VAFFAASRAPLRLPRFWRSAEHGGKLCINLLSFGDEVFDACDLMVDVR
jgi:hypothetical protein